MWRPELIRVALREGWPLGESWTDAARQAALYSRRQRHTGAFPADTVNDLKFGIMKDQVTGSFTPAHNILMSEQMRPLKGPLTVHGGFGAVQSERMGLRDGGVLKEPLGLSRDPDVAEYFAEERGRIVHVNLKQGHPVYNPVEDGGSNPYQREQEMVIPAGTRFKLNHVEHRGDRKHVFLDAEAPS